MRPFHQRVDDRLQTARRVVVVVPLRARIEALLVAECRGFSRHDEHRQLRQTRAVQAHASLHQAHACVQQNRLHPAGDRRVAGSHVDRQQLVPTTEICRARRIADLLPRERFPDRAPVGPRRRHNVVDAEIPAGLKNRIAAIQDLYLHRSILSMGCGYVPRPQRARIASMLSPQAIQRRDVIPHAALQVVLRPVA